jgi:hypothetical protein
MACLSGDFAKGVSILSELFVDTEDPAYIYNQGRCFEQNRHYEDAIGRFQEFLRAGKKLSKGDKAEARKHIADCQELLATTSSPAPTPPASAQPALTPPASETSPPPTRSQPSAPLPTAVVGPPLVQQALPQPASEPDSGLRTTGIIIAAVGGLALASGIVLNLKVNAMASDLQKTDGYTDGKESDRKTYQTLGWVSYGAGAAFVATGAVLYYIGRRQDAPRSASVAFAPAFAPGQAGAFLKGAF